MYFSYIILVISLVPCETNVFWTLDIVVSKVEKFVPYVFNNCNIFVPDIYNDPLYL